jgi:hypothetical protein
VKELLEMKTAPPDIASLDVTVVVNVVESITTVDDPYS